MVNSEIAGQFARERGDWVNAAEDRIERSEHGGNRDQILLNDLDKAEISDRSEQILEGLRGRLSRWFHSPATADGTPIESPNPGDAGIISGAAAMHITRAEWMTAREAGALIVFYKDEKDPLGHIFRPPTNMGEANDRMGQDLHHARIIPLPKAIATGTPIQPHDHKDFKKRETAGKLGFGDPESGLMRTDGMVISVHDGKNWMDQPQALPLMRLDIDPNVQALHYGSAIFEGMACERNKEGKICIYGLKEHYERLMRGADAVRLPRIPFDQFEKAVMKAITVNERFIPEADMGRLYIRPNLFSCAPWLKVGNAKATALVVTTSPIGNANAYFGELKEEKVSAIPRTRLRTARGVAIGPHKAAGNYAGTIEAIEIAQKLGLEGGIAYLDRLVERPEFPSLEGKGKRGSLKAIAKWAAARVHQKVQEHRAEFRETNASNLFAFEDLGGGRWKIITAPLDSKDILPGLTRRLILKIAHEFGWEVEEAPIRLSDAKKGRYKFMAASGTAAYLTPIHGLQMVDIGTREELGEVDPHRTIDSEEADRAYREESIGRKAGNVIYLQDHRLKPKELFPEPLSRVMQRMEEIKRGGAIGDPEFADLVDVLSPEELRARAA